MPIFEYNCRKCKHHFETIVLSTREKIACPKCQSNAVAKTALLVQLPRFRTGSCRIRRWLRLHAADLRLPLELFRRVQITRQLGANALERFADV